MDIPKGSFDEFIAEHYWGYTRVDEKSTYAYEVEHPRWQVFEVETYDISVDFKALYGDDFKTLSNQRPDSVILAEGSEIVVKSKKRV